MASYATGCWKKVQKKNKIAFQNVRAAEFVAALFDRGPNTLQSGSVRVTDSYTQDLDSTDWTYRLQRIAWWRSIRKEYQMKKKERDDRCR